MAVRNIFMAISLPVTIAVAETLTIKNACSFTVYYNSGGSTISIAASKSSVSTLPSSGTVTYRIGETTGFSAPLDFEFIPEGSSAYHDVSCINGCPLAANGFSLVPSISTCPAIHGGADYTSNGATPECASSANFVFTVC